MIYIVESKAIIMIIVEPKAIIMIYIVESKAIIMI